jgi:hypothetical protein
MADWSDFLVLYVPLGAEKAANYIVQPMRCKVLSYCLAPAIAVWISGEKPSNPEKDNAAPNQVLLFPRHHLPPFNQLD